jgi:hypothetical protein
MQARWRPDLLAFRYAGQQTSWPASFLVCQTSGSLLACKLAGLLDCQSDRQTASWPACLPCCIPARLALPACWPNSLLAWQPAGLPAFRPDILPPSRPECQSAGLPVYHTAGLPDSRLASLMAWHNAVLPACCHSQNFVSCSRVIKCVAVNCRPNIVFYSDQSVYKITLKTLIQILKFYNTNPNDATNIVGTRSTHTQLIVSILNICR